MKTYYMKSASEFRVPPWAGVGVARLAGVCREAVIFPIQIPLIAGPTCEARLHSFSSPSTAAAHTAQAIPVEGNLH